MFFNQSTISTPLSFLPLIFCVVIVCSTAVAQTTAFSYQGSLSEAGNPVTGTRFFRFTLFDENGAAIPGATLDQSLIVTNGVFNTSLDFGPGVFPGANRSLEIAVKINVGDPFTILNPRQGVLSAPYSIKSKSAENSDQLGGVDPSLFVQQDAGGNVSIAGGLTVNGSLSLDTVNAQTQYNLGGQRILGNAGNSNLFVGTGAGVSNAASFNTFVGNLAGNANTAGDANAFFGNTAGFKNTTGGSNSFFGAGAGANNLNGGSNAFFGALTGLNNTASFNSFFGFGTGQNNTVGNSNAFFGSGAGFSNTTASDNAIFGAEAGFTNQLGTSNAFFGRKAGYANTASANAFFGAFSGQNNTTASGNSFFGDKSGQANTTGVANSFFGSSAGVKNGGSLNAFFGNASGANNTTGAENAFFGTSAGFSNVTGSRNAFFGVRAGGSNTANNNAFFGYESGFENTTGSGNSIFGYGAGSLNTTGSSNSFFGGGTGFVNTTGLQNTFLGSSAGNSNTTGSSNTMIGSGTNVAANNLTNATAIGANALVSTNNSMVLGGINGVNGATANTNVGIGTTSPASRFHVVGSSWFQGDNTPLPNTAGKGIVIGFSGEQGYISSFDYGSFTPKTLLLNLGGGNVGVGTNTPNSKLAVAGLIETTTGGVKFPDGTIQTTAGGGSRVTSLNGLTNNVTLAAGSNITITPSGNTLTIAATGGGILNQTTVQTSANFNIDGTGTANIFNAATQYNLGGSRILSGSESGGNVFAGFNTGTVNARFNNSFFGVNSGASNMFGSANSFFGFNAGTSNTNGGNNTFVGVGSGIGNTNGGGNTFVGAGTGQQNITGNDNSFFGFGAGLKNTADINSFFGRSAGGNTTSGAGNVFLGWQAGLENATGSNNTVLGSNAGVPIGSTNLSDATAIGANAIVSQSNSVVLGSVNGVNGGVDTKVGIGTTAPKAKLDVTGGNILIGSPGQGIVLKSPDGATCKLFSIDNAGAMVLTTVACP